MMTLMMITTMQYFKSETQPTRKTARRTVDLVKEISKQLLYSVTVVQEADDILG